MKYVIWGWTTVFNPDGAEVRDHTVFRQLSGYLVDLYATDYIGGTEPEDALASALERSGQLRIEYREGEDCMRVVSVYVTKRALSAGECALLVGTTLGQWSDGMGESVFVEAGPFEDFKLQPLSERVAGVPDYPFVEIRPD